VSAPGPLDLAHALDGLPAFESLANDVASGRALTVGGLWGSSQGLALSLLTQRAQGPWLVVCSTEAEAEAFAEDLAAFGVEPVLFPARDGGATADPESVRRRLQVAQLLSGPPERRPRLVVASLLAMLQPIPSAGDLEGDFLHLQTGQRLELDELLERLVATGYTRQPLAERPGEVSLRGDVCDVFPFAAELPLRIELFDDEVESLRTFDPETQRSVEALPKVALCIAADAGGIDDGKGVAPAGLLAPTTVVVEIEPLRIADQAGGLRIRSSGHARALAGLEEATAARSRLALQSLPEAERDFATRSIQGLMVGMHDAPRAVREVLDDGANVTVLCRTEPDVRRVRDLIDAAGDALAEGLDVRLGSVARGFRLLRDDAPPLVVVNHRELAGVLGARGRSKERKQHRVRALESFFELRPGDLVVHAVHGLARFVGLVRMERAGGEEEHLQLEFANEVSLYVPSSRIDIVQRYVGSTGSGLELDKIGGQAFRRRKEKVERGLIDLASELLDIQARREMQRRPAWRPDADLVRDLVDSFPFADTADQATADQEIADDLTSGKPMDRLLCGDVGFGKTEISLRAAFRVVSAGGQVAILVPTTVLSQQHYETFRERLAAFPVEIEVVSRYVTGKRLKHVVERVAKGEVDILIGTHRLLSKDVEFARLGLVIIDEEQRFGVKHKEHFKRLRSEVDVLALSATPIPRTLHMSLAGLRDISALTIPPPGRQDIVTKLVRSEDRAQLRETLLREHNRGGQTFFLHNRVRSIERVATELAVLVPECSFAVGHGQMHGRELQQVMGSFTRGEVDVLVATTIVENGIDIPSAGTIVIDDADRFGLAELHQLRGRVGRGRHQAYCYLRVDRSKPIRDVARERLKALEELTKLGSGFQISMKDLEIRGAGNLLGAEQSGHIAAIGYDMYCRLLHQTVERLQHGAPTPEGRAGLVTEVPAEVTAQIEAGAVELELGVRAFLPDDWIEGPTQRLELLRRLNDVHGEEDADEALAEMRDRFGRVPDEAVALVRQFRLRARLGDLGIRRLLWREETYLVEFADRVSLEQVLAAGGAELRSLRAGMGHIVVPADRRDAAAALDWIEGLLHAAPTATRLAEA
jgi:transcription-repair coupling factor (superfamily II helicase)